MPDDLRYCESQADLEHCMGNGWKGMLDIDKDSEQLCEESWKNHL